MENVNTLIGPPGLETIESENMAARLKPSPSGGRNSITKDRQNASPEEKSEAASTIAGAMMICKDFGIKVDYANADGKLVLIVHNVQAVPQPSGKLAFKYIES